MWAERIWKWFNGFGSTPFVYQRFFIWTQSTFHPMWFTKVVVQRTNEDFGSIRRSKEVEWFRPRIVRVSRWAQYVVLKTIRKFSVMVIIPEIHSFPGWHSQVDSSINSTSKKKRKLDLLEPNVRDDCCDKTPQWKCKINGVIFKVVAFETKIRKSAERTPKLCFTFSIFRKASYGKSLGWMAWSQLTFGEAVVEKIGWTS